MFAPNAHLQPFTRQNQGRIKGFRARQRVCNGVGHAPSLPEEHQPEPSVKQYSAWG
jgi:hypothetical protein